MGTNHSYSIHVFQPKWTCNFRQWKKSKRELSVSKDIYLQTTGKEGEKSREKHNPSPVLKAERRGRWHILHDYHSCCWNDENLHSQTSAYPCGTHVGLSGLLSCGKMQSWTGSLACSETMHHRNSIFWALAPLRCPLTTTFAAAMSIKRRQASSKQGLRLLKVKKKRSAISHGRFLLPWKRQCCY